MTTFTGTELFANLAPPKPKPRGQNGRGLRLATAGGKSGHLRAARQGRCVVATRSLERSGQELLSDWRIIDRRSGHALCHSR